MADGVSQKVLDNQYGRIEFKQSKGIDNSNIATEVIHKAKGGTASSRADGCAQRGKTKGRIV